MTALHVLLIVRSTIDQWSVALLVLAALVLAGTSRLLNAEFRAQPVAFLVFHVVAYLLVAGSLSVHVMAVGGDTNGVDGLKWMVACWGAGLLVHALATVGEFLPRGHRA